MVIGLVGDSGAGVENVLRAAGGQFFGAADPLDLQSRPLIAIAYTLDLCDAATRILVEPKFEELRKAGSRILLASHDFELLQRVADEVWWIEGGEVRKKGDSREVLGDYRRHVLQKVRESAASGSAALQPTLRRGDGRAELTSIETLNTPGDPVSVWRSGEDVAIRVRVKFREAVADPVVGIMIRTRIGMEVFGTNTELERVRVGPCGAGDERTVTFRFLCALCPQYYTITAASHDPDGVWHDWLEDAVSITVADTRYTAGVANLRAQVDVS